VNCLVTSALGLLSGTGQCTVFVVGTGSTSATAMIVEHGPTVGTTAGTFNVSTIAGGSLLYSSNGSGANFDQGSFTPGPACTSNVAQVNFVLDLTISSGLQGSCRFNRASQSLTNSGTDTTGTFTSQVLNIGARNNGGNYPWTGTVGEIVIYNRTLPL